MKKILGEIKVIMENLGRKLLSVGLVMAVMFNYGGSFDSFATEADKLRCLDGDDVACDVIKHEQATNFMIGSELMINDRKEFNKLVRDKIPEIIREKGGNPEFEILDDADYLKLLNNKLLEECNEVITAETKEDKTEELADLLEVIMAMSKFMDIDFDTVDRVRQEKKTKRGGFDSRIFLKATTLVNI